MTAIRDRQGDPETDDVAIPWDARPVVGERRGLPWWGAVLLAFVLAIVGAVVDMQTQNNLGWVFNICFFVGAVGAICAVQRRSLFGPMVQPPLVLAVAVPLVVLLISGVPANSDTLAKALAIATPLINGFPTMAVATACTLIIGILRLYRQRNPDAVTKDGKDVPPSEQRTRRVAAARRPGKPQRDASGMRDSGPEGRRGPADGRGPVQRAAGGEPHPSLPMTPRRRPEDVGGRRGEPAGRNERGGDPVRGAEPGGRRRGGGGGGDDAPGRGGKTPAAPRGRRPQGQPPEGDRRRGGAPQGDRPRRTPPRGGPGEPRGEGGEPPRRGPGRRGGPPPRRPWDDEPN